MDEAENRAWDWVPAAWQPVVLGGLCLVALGFFAAAAWPKLRTLARARPEQRCDRPLARLKDTIRIAFLQTRLFREPRAGLMHALIFWGFLILLLRAAQFFAIGFFPAVGLPAALDGLYGAYGLAKDGVVALVALAVGYALYRRLKLRPARLTLSGEGLLILVLILLILASDVLFEAAHAARHPEAATWLNPLGWSLAGPLSALPPGALVHLHNGAYWAHVSAILFFITLLPRGKHFHILTSIPNVYFSRPGPGGTVRRLDFEDETQETFGVTHIGEFTWKNLLDLHTCTECGRCDAVCPALASGKPLSPKQLTVDLRNHLKAETPWILAPEKQRAETAPELLGGVIGDETLWSCTTCGACETECPVMIEYVGKIIGLRRGLVLTHDRYPEEFAQAFRSLETQGNPWGFPRDTRADWAANLNIPLWDKDRSTEYLYFVGCNGAFDSRGRKIAEAVAASLKAAGVEFSILGTDEGCTGDPARRAGNEYLFEQLASQNAQTFQEKGVRKVITHCPHCLNSLKNEYPEFGASLEVIHHSELLARLMKEGRLPGAEAAGGRVVFHDSCYLGRHNDVYDPPREVARAAGGTPALEVEHSRDRGSCCGAGGARFLLEEKVGERMSHRRLDELLDARPDTIATSCPFCVLMLEDALKAKNLSGKVQVRDIAELGRK